MICEALMGAAAGAAGRGAVSTELPDSGGPRPALLLIATALLSLSAAGGLVRLIRPS